MPRAIWSGAISFGLVNVPVKLFPAVSAKEVRFHLLHEEDGARIEQKRVCSRDGAEVAWDHVVKGYEIARGKYVVVTREELEALDPEATHTIEIEDFVDLAQIDPIYYERTYYAHPDRGAARPYVLLHAAMVRTGKVAIARMVMRTRQHLCVVRPLGRALCLATMQYADEIVPASKLEGLPAVSTKPSERELRLAQQLVESLARDFVPTRYRDEYRERVLELVERKAKGRAIAVEAAAERPAEVVNLLDALHQSLASRKAEAPRKGPAVRKATARRARSRRARPAA